MRKLPFLRRVRLRNYKSIAFCDVPLKPLIFLVGPNGSGKSNFLDALRLVSDALQTSLDHAIRERGGIKEVRRRSGGHPTHFSILLDFDLGAGGNGKYSFKVGAKQEGGYEVQEEECILRSSEFSHESMELKESKFTVKSGQVTSNLDPVPAATPDRLYLVNASGLKPFRPLYDALSRMGFYNLNPAVIRELQPPDAGALLKRDGSNVASVLSQLSRNKPEIKVRIEEYLGKVVPGILGVDARHIGPKETVEFRQVVAGAENPWRFLASNMSDGTLRVLGILVALFQNGSDAGNSVPLVGIEEPEVALHPGAAGVLLDGLMDASSTTQVLVTSHSPDLLDDKKIETDSILAVSSEMGTTRIARPDPAGWSALRDRLYTPGELLRLNQLKPDPEDGKEPQEFEQLSLDPGEAP